MKSFQSPLSTLEEKQYLEQLKNGSEQAKSVLIERNLRLVAHIARKYQGTQEDMEDLISIGTVGLIKAVSTYNLEKGSRLGTYAARCIENELLMYFRSKKKTARDVSLYEPIGTDKEGNQIKLLDIVESGEPELWERVVEKKNILRLYELVSEVLDERENWIIRRRYGLYNTKPVTQREIANNLYATDPHSNALFAYFKFNEGKGDRFTDATGNGNDMRHGVMILLNGEIMFASMLTIK